MKLIINGKANLNNFFIFVFCKSIVNNTAPIANSEVYENHIAIAYNELYMIEDFLLFKSIWKYESSIKININMSELYCLNSCAKYIKWKFRQKIIIHMIWQILFFTNLLHI